MEEFPLKFSCLGMEVVVKNTFLEFSPPLQALPRNKSAPALMQLSPDLSVQTPVAGRNSVAGGGNKPASMQMPASRPEMQKDAASNVAKLSKDEEHRLGLCRPCSYFTFKDDGCHKGNDCEFCHMCSNEGARERRRQIKRELGGKAAPPATRGPWSNKNKTLRYKKPCPALCCA
eukprot:TRINITY_DN3414_c0_g1_i2.p1 TRINITY_DN3414_c0_g1~~TRINITY_DN3414_c0_g1_i2.p1  ORF type:complete len:174 (+),score=33.11 TRINITY_DN3414_c0_g1_i2:58-579(+)